MHPWYPWGGSLDEAGMARALAAAPLAPRAASVGEAAAEILERLERGRPLELSGLPLPHEPFPHDLPPEAYARAWEDAWQAFAATAEAQLVSTRTAGIPPESLRAAGGGWPWFHDLRRGLLATELVSVVAAEPSPHAADWRWPLRIGVLTPDGSLAAVEEARRHYRNGRLFHLQRAGVSRRRFDLLLVDGPRELVGRARCTASAVVLLGDPEPNFEAELAVLGEVRERLRTPVTISQPRPADPGRWLLDLVYELAHTRRLDLALDWIARPRALDPPLVLCDLGALEGLDLPHAMQRILASAHRLVRRGAGMQEVPLSPRLQSDLELPRVIFTEEELRQETETVSAPLTDLLASLEGSLDALVYDREEHGATTLGEFSAAVARAERMADRRRAGKDLAAWAGSLPRQEEGGRRRDRRATLRTARGKALAEEGTEPEGLRLLRARLLEADGGPHAHGMLSPGEDYEIQVSVGPPEASWLGLPTPFVVPDAPPDDPERGWSLRVVAWEPTWIPQPLERELWLPEAGPTEVVSFPFHTDADPGPLGARITVLHENRVLQTGYLGGGVEGRELTWDLDAAPEPQLGVLDETRWFDASFVLNDDVHGKPRATCIADHQLGLLDLDQADLETFADTVATYLNRISAEPELYASLTSDDTVALLRSIAQHGWNLYEALVEDTRIDPGRLAAAGRIQVVSAKPTSYFPAEFLYSLPPPDPDATLCPGAEAALRSDGRCSQPHTRAVVCPTGFWSLSKVVERHAFLKEDLDGEAPFVLYDALDFSEAPTLDPLRHLAVAASQKVDGFDPHATESLKAKAVAVAVGCTPIDSLEGWETAVRDDRPSAFVLLPHHFRQDLHEKFEMGPALVIQPSQLRRELLRGKGSPPPVVLIVGCETLDTRIAFDSFVQKFRRYGASIVISTYATILGRHAAPATADLLDTLDKLLAAGPVRLGDVLLALRRRLLAEGKPMALGLTSYGDADIVLARD